jgi:methylmalonyl-CoA mutase N-terminal domain/subunit
VESGARIVVGVNAFAGDETEAVELQQVDPEIERRQRERTAHVRSERAATEAAAALDEVRRTAESDEHLLPPMREALRVGCTIGEICGALRELWGTYDANA